MKSYWSIWCEGATCKVQVKKLERLLGVQAIEPETERIILDGKKFEVVDFFLDHPCGDWSALVAEVIRVSSHLSPRWSICIGTADISATWPPEQSDEIAGISGITRASWQVRASQEYLRQKLLGATGTNMW